MAFFNLLSMLLMTYSTIYLLKCYNKLNFLQRLGIEVSLFQIKWSTQRFNRFFLKCGNWHRNLIIAWFSFGAVFSCLLILPSMMLLVRTLINTLFWFFESQPSSESADSFMLQPVVPGLNMPLAKTGHYVLTLLICSVVHEFGHAVTSVVEDVTVIGAGVFVVLVVPAAFVDISTAELNSIRKLQQLRIFTAGIWNNVVLALLAFGILFIMPLLCSPIYAKDEGVAVMSIEQNSSILGPSGLKVGDVIRSVNGCGVKDSKGWHHCLALSDHNPAQSFCINTADASIIDVTVDCCKNNSGSLSSLCFVNTDRSISVCLKVRAAIETSTVCNATTACASSSACLSPELKSPSKLLQIKRRAEKDFLFVGNSAEVYYYSQITDYVLKYPNHWSAAIFGVSFPSTFELLLYYTASLSSGLAVLNVIPCFMLDGQHVARVLVEAIFRHYDKSLRSIILLSLTIVGTLLVVLNIVLGVVRLLL